MQRQTWDSLGIGDLLRTYTGLRLLPVVDDNLRVGGMLAFSASGNGLEEITDRFHVQMSFPKRFPCDIPLVKELGGRIPKDFHTNPDGTLCLGSRTSQRLELIERPTLLGFIDRCLIPYFYTFLYFKRHGVFPFGELKHGWKGIRQEHADRFGVKSESAAVAMVELASLEKRAANKRLCPCGSGRRLGRCHNRRVNKYRRLLGRAWFRAESRMLAGQG